MNLIIGQLSSVSLGEVFSRVSFYFTFSNNDMHIQPMSGSEDFQIHSVSLVIWKIDDK